MISHIELSELEVFTVLSQTLSFTDTSRRLRIERTLVSKKIQKLEDVLGVKLFERTTRNVRLTQEGQILLLRAKEILGAVETIDDLFTKPVRPKGLVRFSAPVTVSQSILPEILAKVFKLYPEIKLEVLASNRILDFVEEGLDFTIRASEPKDSSMIGKLLIPNEIVFAAAPKYLKRMGTPKNLKDLKEHSLFYLDFHRDCYFKKHQIKLSTFDSNRSLICADGRLLIRMAEEGQGICVRPRWDLKHALESKTLVEIILTDTLIDRAGIYLLYPKTKFLPKRTKVVIDCITEHFTN